LTLVLLLAPASPAIAAPQQGEPADKVRVVYRAPEACPDEAAFLSAVRNRIGSDWEAAAGESARRIEVTVDATATGSTARLDFVDDDGHHVSRALVGASCADVVSGIALVTALAIDSRFTHDESQAPNTSANVEASSAGTSNDAGAQPAPTPPNAATPANAHTVTAARGVSTNAPSPGAAERRAQGGAHAPWKGEVAAFGAIATGIGPALAFGGRAVAGLVWPSGADLRIGVDYVVIPQTTIPVYGDVNIAMYELSGRASGCPLGLSIGKSVLVSPCAGIASGIVHGETRKSPGVVTPDFKDPAFVALFAEARVDARFGAFFLEASGELRFVVDPSTFALSAPNDDPLARMNQWTAFASLGLGLLL
jgi:hypothetical protein